MISKDNKHKAIALTQVNKNDVGSPQAQVSVLTARIKEVTEHLKVNKHDFMARRGLVQMVGKRKRLLKYLERTDFESYKKVVAALGLRKSTRRNGFINRPALRGAVFCFSESY